jgi:hypothetical protein
VLLTRSRLCLGPKPDSSLHLHVLSTPPAFVLSQDQTLREVSTDTRERAPDTKSCHRPMRAASYTGPAQVMTGFLSQTLAISEETRGVEPGRTPSSRLTREGAHAVEFSKTVAPCREGVSFERTLPWRGGQGAGPSSLAPLGAGRWPPGQTRGPCSAVRQYRHTSRNDVGRVAPRTLGGRRRLPAWVLFA